MAATNRLTADTQCSGLAAKKHWKVPINLDCKKWRLQTVTTLYCLPGYRHHEGRGQEGPQPALLKHPQAALQQQGSLLHSVAEACRVGLQGSLHARLEGLHPSGMQVAQLLVEGAAHCAVHLLQELCPLGLAHTRLKIAGLIIIPCTAGIAVPGWSLLWLLYCVWAFICQNLWQSSPAGALSTANCSMT